jgi:hypothetical protein
MGTTEKQVRYALPASMDEALKIAITVCQAELPEYRNEAFYLNSEARNSNSANRPARGAHRRNRGKYSTPHHKAEGTLRQGNQGPSRDMPNRDVEIWYEFGDVGHYPRECPSCRNWRKSHGPVGNGNRGTQQGSSGPPPPDIIRKSKESVNDRLP